MKKVFVLLAAFVGYMTTVSTGCKKNDNAPQQNAGVMVVNASPGDSVGYDFYFNDAKLNTQPFSYPSNSAYLPLTPNNYTIKIAASNTINPLVSAGYAVGSGKSYSVFAYDTLLAGKIKVFAAEDDLTAPASGKAKLRFFHLSPVNIPVDILLNDSLVFANRSYADNVGNSSKAAFVSVDAGAYTVKIKLAGSPSSIPALLTLDNISFLPGTIYTVYAKGKINASGVDALGAAVIVNK